MKVVSIPTGPRIGVANVTTTQIGVGAAVIVGPPGPKGDKGDAGDGTYTLFSQDAPASIWTITHTLGRYPDVTILDSTGRVVWADVEYPSVSQVTITFASPQIGKVILL